MCGDVRSSARGAAETHPDPLAVAACIATIARGAIVAVVAHAAGHDHVDAASHRPTLVASALYAARHADDGRASAASPGAAHLARGARIAVVAWTVEGWEHTAD